jgi:hypothetical protein
MASFDAAFLTIYADFDLFESKTFLKASSNFTLAVARSLTGNARTARSRCAFPSSSSATMSKNLPENSAPVLALIRGISDLSSALWWEVVYYDDDNGCWCAYFGSDTFADGEVVLGWIYCDGLDQHAAFHKLR